MVVSNVEQLTSPVYDMAEWIFFLTQLKAQSKCGNEWLVAGCTKVQNSLCQCCHFKVGPRNRSLGFSKSGLRNSRWQAPVFVCLLSCITIWLVQTADRGTMLAFAWDDISHVLTQGSTATQKSQRPVGILACAVCSLDAGLQILENKGKVRINFFQLLV